TRSAVGRSAGAPRRSMPRKACAGCVCGSAPMSATSSAATSTWSTPPVRDTSLFLADLIHRNGTGRRFKRKPAEVPPPPRPVAHRQLVLFDLPRDLHAGLRSGFPPPPDPGLEAA